MRDKIANLATDVAAHFKLVENVEALQKAQKEMADTLKIFGDRIRELETEMKVWKAEVKFEALKETQGIINAVQSGLNQRIEDLAVKIALTEKAVSSVPQLPLRPFGQDKD